MALNTTFNRLKREIGIKKCVIVDGNVGDVYLNDKKQIVDLKQYLMDMLKGMEYDDVLYWDRIDGVDGDISGLSVIDEVEVEGDAYSFDDDDEEATPNEEEKTGSGLFKEPSEIFNIIFKNLKKPNRKIAFVLNCRIRRIMLCILLAREFFCAIRLYGRYREILRFHYRSCPPYSNPIQRGHEV